jgi:hypothetical protein
LKLLLAFVCAILPIVSLAQTSTQTRTATRLTITVLDENGVAVAAARILLQGPAIAFHCQTNLVGECHFVPLPSGEWRLRVEKEGFYILTLSPVQSSGTLEVSLTHQREIRETVNVTESPPAIDPSQVSSREQLSGIDITNIPYPNTRDYRYALNYIPGIVLDQTGQPHIAGGETYQTLVLLDGFNLTQPANGQLLVRVSTDALRTVNAETTRLPAQYGKGPAGVVDLETGIGDDHYRFAATNFLPSFQNKKGWTLDKVDPRFTVSGPIRKRKIWFFDGLDGEYDNLVILDLPAHEDTNHIWRTGNLAKLQANVTARDIVTTNFLINRLHDDHFKFSTLAPPTTTPEDSESAYITTIKEQHVFAKEKLLEVGFAFDRYGVAQIPTGTASYVLTPESAQGNYYLHASTVARRLQGLANFYVPRLGHDRHDLSFGVDIDRVSYDQLFERSPITVTRACPANNPSCYPISLRSVFSGAAPSTTLNAEMSGYMQDRWSATHRLLIEPGLRFDWDEVVRRPLFSPRLAATYVLNDSGTTKISAGVGVIYQSTSLSLIAQPEAGSRTDTFYDLNGNPTTFDTRFRVDRGLLNAPRFINWSVALEQKLPAQLFLKTEFMRRSGIHGFVFDTPPGSTDFLLQNSREDTYYSFKIDLRRTFRQRYVLTGSYTRSGAHSNQVLDYSLDNLVISRQVAGPYPWDAPNRFISWGILPLAKGFDFAYSLEARSGFPFPILNQQQQLVLPPGKYRFDKYFTLNPHIEKRFHALGFYWALRGGFDNITNHQNAYVVNNILGSPQYLTFSNFDRRAFTARIRFLGRK